MDLNDSPWMLAIGEHWRLASLAMVRVMACFAWLPFLASGTIVSMMVRMTVSLWVVIGLWPVIAAVQVPHGTIAMVWAVGREGLIGMALGLVMALPFQALHAFGAIIDNQRGANIGSSLDPVSGVDATESATLMQMLGMAMFLAVGGMTEMLEALRLSFVAIGLDGEVQWSVQRLSGYIGALMLAALRMSAPVVCLLMLVEILLGVLSRFAQQMNAFSVALAVKSLVAFCALLAYFTTAITENLFDLWHAHSAFELMKLASP